MAFELDHLFICTAEGAPAADLLQSVGLVEGSSNEHLGQGTANRRFFFHNFMVELLWVNRPDEAMSDPVQPIHLWERWHGRNQGTCPFGLCLRSEGQTSSNLPFTTWSYRPRYLPPTLSIEVATNAAVLTEPLLFYIPFGRRPDAYPAEKAQPLDHGLGLAEVTRLTVVMPHLEQISPELQALAQTKQIYLQSGEAYRVEIGFDGEMQGKRVDFYPTLPLTLRW